MADVDTNVSLATVDFATGAVVSTNHCVISSILKNGNSITFTRHDDRLPMAWDVPDGTITNDCRNAFVAMPQLSNAFWFTIAVTNLPSGNYNVSIDGARLITLSSSQLATGWNMFTDWSSNSPYWKQRIEVLRRVRIKNGVDPVTLGFTHGAGDTPVAGPDLIIYESHSRGWWEFGVRGDTLIAALAPEAASLNGYDARIHDAAQPTNHIFSITPSGQTITFPSPGDQVYGVPPITLGATASSGLTVLYSITSGPASVSNNILTITGAGSVTIQASQPGDSNWPAATPVSQSITVAQKALTGSITASNRVYDGTPSAAIATRTLTGVVGTDAVSLTGGTAVFSDKTVGIGKTVTVTGLSLTGTDAAKYVLGSTSATTIVNITAAPLTVTGITTTDKVYDNTTTATVITNHVVLLGIIGTDAVTLDGTATGAFTDANAAPGKTVTFSGLTLGGSDAGNYFLTQLTTTASITPASTLNVLGSSVNPAPTASTVTFTATLSVVPPGGGAPTGNILFKDGITPLETNTLNDSAQSFLNTDSLPHGSHTIFAEYQGDGNFLGSTNFLNQIIDAPPVASNISLQRYAGAGVKIRSSLLLTNDTDPDGDLLKLISVNATSDSGAIVMTNGDWICYQPPPGFTNSDTFSRIIADSFGLQSTGLVTVVVSTDTNAFQNFAPVNGIVPKLVSLNFLGIPKREYTIQYTTNLESPTWQTLGTAAAGDTGSIQFFDNPPTNSPPRYYHTTYP